MPDPANPRTEGIEPIEKWLLGAIAFFTILLVYISKWSPNDGQYVCPFFTENDQAYERLGNSKPISQFALEDAGVVHGSDVDNLGFAQPCASVIGPARHHIASFFEAVHSIVGRSSSEQMRRAEASFVVAPMAYALPFWYRADEQSVGKSVRSVLPAMMLDLPVSVRKQAPGPLNASVKFGWVRRHLPQQIVAVSLVSHRCALQWRASMAPMALIRLGASLILAQIEVNS